MYIFLPKNQVFKGTLLSKVWTIVLTVTLSLFSLAAMGSAEICVDHVNEKIHIKAHYYFYGAEATPSVVKPCVAEINRMFNQGNRIMLRKEGNFKDVITNVTYSIVTEAKALSIAGENKNPKKNFVRIGNVTPVKNGDISRHGLKSNWGFFLTRNKLGSSTTCAHEFAHGLGLSHSDKGNDWRGKGIPPIMAPRGSLVDSIYQSNPKAKAGAKGGTINPKFREVHVQEFTNLRLGSLDYSWKSPSTECASLGSAGNIIFKKNGTHFPMPEKSSYHLMSPAEFLQELRELVE